MSGVPSDTWVETALNVTGHFEDSQDPLGAVTGDFDGMGISLGVLQWNIGSNSLQPLVAKVGRAAVVALMPHYGTDLWMACTSSVTQGLAVVRGWQIGSTLRQPVRDELKAFTHGAAFREQQIEASRRVASTAADAASHWADEAGIPPSKALFCWFFDLTTQNGGLKGLGYAEVRDYISANGADRADDLVCDWLAARTSGEAGYRDAAKNAALWRDHVDAAQLPLFVLSFLRALKVPRRQYRADVLNRKATIALGQGWVHTERHDLRPLLAN